MVVETKTSDVVEHIKYWADKCGIPPYYYTQVQQQILFLDSKITRHRMVILLVSLMTVGTFVYFFVPRDEVCYITHYK